MEPTDDDALDAYSSVVTRVAELLTPRVAALRFRTAGRRGEAAGSAVVLSDDGHLVTNAHVVGQSVWGEASFSDGSSSRVRVVGRDPLSDLAVVHAVEGVPTAAAELGDADRLKVGSLVVAVGNPLGLSGSVTAGVVSALGRSMPTHTAAATRIIEDVIQTDAALNPGSSGGALADSRGRVVGINTAVAGIGLGLAVPVNTTTRRILTALLEVGRVRRAYLGLVTSPAPLPKEWIERTGRRSALRVVQVVTDSPAAASGMHAGDLLVAVDGASLGDAQSLQRLLFGDAIGRRMEITALRNGALVDVVAYPRELTDP